MCSCMERYRFSCIPIATVTCCSWYHAGKRETWAKQGPIERSEQEHSHQGNASGNSRHLGSLVGKQLHCRDPRRRASWSKRTLVALRCGLMHRAATTDRQGCTNSQLIGSRGFAARVRPRGELPSGFNG